MLKNNQVDGFKKKNSVPPTICTLHLFPEKNSNLTSMIVQIGFRPPLGSSTFAVDATATNAVGHFA